MVVAPTTIVPAVSAAHSEAEQAPAQSCGKGYTYTKLDDRRWKCLTDEDAEKVATEQEKGTTGTSTAATIIIIAIAIVLIIFTVMII